MKKQKKSIAILAFLIPFCSIWGQQEFNFQYQLKPTNMYGKFSRHTRIKNNVLFESHSVPGITTVISTTTLQSTPPVIIQTISTTTLQPPATTTLQAVVTNTLHIADYATLKCTVKINDTKDTLFLRPWPVTNTTGSPILLNSSNTGAPIYSDRKHTYYMIL